MTTYTFIDENETVVEWQADAPPEDIGTGWDKEEQYTLRGVPTAAVHVHDEMIVDGQFSENIITTTVNIFTGTPAPGTYVLIETFENENIPEDGSEAISGQSNTEDVTTNRAVEPPVSYTHLTLPTNREV